MAWATSLDTPTTQLIKTTCYDVHIASACYRCPEEQLVIREISRLRRVVEGEVVEHPPVVPRRSGTVCPRRLRTYAHLLLLHSLPHLDERNRHTSDHQESNQTPERCQ